LRVSADSKTTGVYRPEINKKRLGHYAWLPSDFRFISFMSVRFRKQTEHPNENDGNHWKPRIVTQTFLFILVYKTPVVLLSAGDSKFTSFGCRRLAPFTYSETQFYASIWLDADALMIGCVMICSDTKRRIFLSLFCLGAEVTLLLHVKCLDNSFGRGHG